MRVKSNLEGSRFTHSKENKYAVSRNSRVETLPFAKLNLIRKTGDSHKIKRTNHRSSRIVRVQTLSFAKLNLIRKTGDSNKAKRTNHQPSRASASKP